MTKLNQIVAIEKGVKTATLRDTTDLYHGLTRANLFAGLSRSYEPRDENGDRLPSERTNVQLTVDAVLADVARRLTRLFDVTYTKDEANTHARADVTVDGVVLAEKVPVTYLLFLEKQVTDVLTVLRSLPTLDPAESWRHEAVDGDGVYRTTVTQTTRTKKVPRAHVLYEATDRHPAQVEQYHEDVIIGDWSLIKFSGAVPADRKDQLVTRAVKLIEAVKQAREQANQTDVTDVVIGERLFSWLLA